MAPAHIHSVKALSLKALFPNVISPDPVQVFLFMPSEMKSESGLVQATT